MRGESLGGPGSIPGMECLRSITPLAHLIFPKVQPRLPSDQTASGIRAQISVRVPDIPVVQLRENARI